MISLLQTIHSGKRSVLPDSLPLQVTMVAALLLVILLAPLLSAQDMYDKCQSKCVKAALKDLEPAVWDSTNCNLGGDSGTVLGLVVDAVCANVQVDGQTKGCSSLDKATCDSSQGRCKWGGPADSPRCLWNRDEKNDVCVGLAADIADNEAALPEGVNNCNDIVNERCPAAWQVPTGCCLEEQEKYSGILSSRPGFTCCNAPCTSLEAMHSAGGQVNLVRLASVTTQLGNTFENGTVCSASMGSRLCAPGMRSYMSSYGAGGNGGMLDRSMQYKVMGMYGGEGIFGGSINPGFGNLKKYLGGGGYMGKVKVDEKEEHVDEISVDDFMDVLIKALDSDDDVFESSYKMTSDIWHGKQEYGNMYGMKLDDPMAIFDSIYGGKNYYGGGYGSRYGGGYGSLYGQAYRTSDPYAGYGASTYGASTYGANQGYGAPAYGFNHGYGVPSYGSNEGYGALTYGASPAYGMPTYGAPQSYGKPTYGAPPVHGKPTYGAPPAYGKPTYGAPPAYGKPAYGAPPTYGQEASYSQPPTYKQPSYTNAQPSYDQKQHSYSGKQPSYIQKQPSYNQEYQPTQDYKPPTNEYKPPTQEYQPPTQDYKPPTQDYQPTQDYKPPTTNDYKPPTPVYPMDPMNVSPWSR